MLIKLAIFEKLLAFWITVVQITKILCAKMVFRMAIISKFPAFGLVFVVFPLLVDLAPNVGFRQFWYF